MHRFRGEMTGKQPCADRPANGASLCQDMDLPTIWGDSWRSDDSVIPKTSRLPFSSGVLGNWGYDRHFTNLKIRRALPGALLLVSCGSVRVRQRAPMRWVGVSSPQSFMIPAEHQLQGRA